VQAMEPAQLALRGGDARVVMVVGALRRRRRKHHLPAERRAVHRVLREEALQQCGPGAGQPGDEERPPHRLRGQGGVPLALPFHPQPVREQADHVLSRRDAAEKAQLGFVLEVGDQPPQRLAEASIPEVVQTRPLLRLLDEQLVVEPDEREPTGALDDAPAAAQRTCERAHAPRASRCSSATIAAASSCHAISPGTPSTSSLTRFASESASAVSGASPTTRPSITYPPSCTPSAPGTANAPARTACPRLSSMIASARPT